MALILPILRPWSTKKKCFYLVKKAHDNNVVEYLYRKSDTNSVPYAMIYHERLFYTHIETDIRQLLIYFPESNGFYRLPGEEKPFFMDVLEVRKSKIYENMDLSRGIEKKDIGVWGAKKE